MLLKLNSSRSFLTIASQYQTVPLLLLFFFFFQLGLVKKLPHYLNVLLNYSRFYCSARSSKCKSKQVTSCLTFSVPYEIFHDPAHIKIVTSTSIILCFMYDNQ